MKNMILQRPNIKRRIWQVKIKSLKTIQKLPVNKRRIAEEVKPATKRRISVHQKTTPHDKTLRFLWSFIPELCKKPDPNCKTTRNLFPSHSSIARLVSAVLLQRKKVFICIIIEKNKLVEVIVYQSLSVCWEWR